MRTRRFISGLTTITMASALHAQVIPEVHITGNAATYDARRDDTAAKIVVNNEELVKYGDGNIADSLKRVPGVTVISTWRGSDIRLRGLGSGYTQILVNGEPAAVGFSIDSLNPAQVERVEVFRSATAEFSTAAVAGTINIVLKKTVRAAQRQFQAGYGGSPAEHTPRAAFLLSDKDGNFSYSLSGNGRVTWINRNLLITDTGETTEVTHSHEIARLSVFNLLPRLSWTLASGDTVSSESILSYNAFDFNAERQSDVLLNWRIATRNVSGKSDVVWNTRLDPDTRLEIKAGVQAADGSNDSARFLSPALNSVNVDTRDQGFTTSGRLTRNAGDAHRLMTGWEASILHRAEINDERNLPGIRTLTDIDAKVWRSAAFIQDEWTLSPSWSVYLGARWERITTDIEAGGSAHASTDVWSPIAQTLVKFPGQQASQVRLAVTRTFNAPDLINLIPRVRRYEINAATNPDLEGNTALKPEIATGIDLTYEHFFTKNALVSVGVSSRDISNYMQTVITLGDDGRWIGRPVNAGRAQVRGLELEAKLPLPLLNASLPAIDLRSSLSRNWSSVDQVPGPNNRVAQQVPRQATLAMDYSAGSVTTGGSFIFRQGAWSTVTAAQSTYVVTRRDLDLYALWKLDAKQQIRITLGNVLRTDDIAFSQYRSLQTGVTSRTTMQPSYASMRALLEQKF